jgi:hypothetical protein
MIPNEVISPCAFDFDHNSCIRFPGKDTNSSDNIARHMELITVSPVVVSAIFVFPSHKNNVYV